MPLPTLMKKGVVVPLNPKIKKEELDNYIAVHYVLEVIRYKMEKKEVNMHDRIFLLKSETGTGKSTLFVVGLYRRFYGKEYSYSKLSDPIHKSFEDKLDTDLSVYDFPNDKYTKKNKEKVIKPIQKKSRKIICTQPKVLTAVSKAKENAEADYNPDIELGYNIGYSTGQFKQGISETKGIMYATLGSTVQKLKMHIDEDIMANHDIIIVDECHIRSIELDTGIATIKKFLERNAGNPACPLFIFTSATFDVPKYAKFLETPETNSVLVKGTASTYEIHFAEKTNDNYIQAAADKVIELHEANHDDDPAEADILIFVPGAGEGRSILELLEKSKYSDEFILYRLDSTVVNKGGDAVAKIETMKLHEVKKLEKKPKAIRRVTTTTSVAETGITIKALKYCIECGFDRGTTYTPIHRSNQLITGNVVKSAAKQRYGRVGRDFFGHVYPLYTEGVYNMLPEYALPDTYRSDVSKMIIDLLYNSVPVSFIFDLPKYDKIINLINSCIDPENPSPNHNNGNCNNIYNDKVISNSQIQEVKDFYSYESGIGNVVKITLHNYPEHLLDDLPQDLFISCRNKLISLGFYGTYAGYLLSRLPRTTVEGARMMFSSFAYGASISDCATMSFIADSKFDFVVQPTQARRKKLPAYYFTNILDELVDKKTLKKYFFGSSKNFSEIVNDRFIEGLIIIKYIIHVIRKTTSTDVRKYKKKYSQESIRYSKRPSILSVVNQRLMDKGILLDEFRHILNNRIDVMLTCDELGLISTFPDLDLNRDDVIDQIARLKKCIYAGYKNNLAILNENGAYYTTTGLKIKLKGIQRRSKKILYGSDMLLMSDFQGITYTATSNVYSSMDGWT